jgi:folate-binding protein YgfZ
MPSNPAWLDDYTTLTTSGGTIRLENWSQVQLTGQDRFKFLHNMCTNDILRLVPGQSREAFCTDVKGKILAHVTVIAETDPERLLLLTVPGQAHKLIKHLDRYIIREDVQLADVSSESTWSYQIGSTSEAGLSCAWLWPGGSLTRAANESPVIGADSPIFTAFRVESGFPLFGVDFDESHLPQEINRDAQAISFNKGCYLGQETVARIDALGHVNKKLVVVKFDGTDVPAIGTTLLSGDQEVGKITTSSWSPRLQAPGALAMVKRGANEIGTILQSKLGEAVVITPIARQG